MVAVLNWCLNHWWVFLWLSILGVFESVRDFFFGIAEAIGCGLHIRHQHKVELARARSAPVAEGSGPLPGRCVHRRVVQVRDRSDELVGWLCRGCDKRLPPDWAVAEEDLP